MGLDVRIACLIWCLLSYNYRIQKFRTVCHNFSCLIITEPLFLTESNIIGKSRLVKNVTFIKSQHFFFLFSIHCNYWLTVDGFYSCKFHLLTIHTNRANISQEMFMFYYVCLAWCGWCKTCLLLSFCLFFFSMLIRLDEYLTLKSCFALLTNCF